MNAKTPRRQDAKNAKVRSPKKYKQEKSIPLGFFLGGLGVLAFIHSHA
jgi:hypothetical protein